MATYTDIPATPLGGSSTPAATGKKKRRPGGMSGGDGDITGDIRGDMGYDPEAEAMLEEQRKKKKTAGTKGGGHEVFTVLNG